jgi:hypothetical protein
MKKMNIESKLYEKFLLIVRFVGYQFDVVQECVSVL